MSQEEMKAARPAIASAFAFAVNYNRSHKARPRDFVERNEYRVFLVALKARLEYSHAFRSIDAVGKRKDDKADGRISLKEFMGAQHMVEAWVGKLEDPEAEFQKMDADSGGTISFGEFCDWATKRSLDAEEHKEAAEHPALTKQITITK